ncbi:DUF3299 domain-containing protein [Thalassotalea crassostreae]|uniref:DUF3299 domain-containing protein n=1 Tax=Thalassotalea crassostreae TaxID=1763536 RepID=UPI0008386A56|nr:DUF3299 domain-containing protein [Thalassotalea crassostreae]
MKQLLSLFLILSISVFQSAYAENSFNWATLQPEQQEVIDPFAQLSPMQLDKLGYYLGLVKYLQQQNTDAPKDDKLVSLMQKKDELESWFKSEKMDVDLLLMQRQEIIKLRTENATNTNPLAIGKEITVTGYIVPLNANEPKLNGFFLRQNSPYIIIGHQHTSPDANQTIWIESDKKLSIKALDKAVSLTGVLTPTSVNKTVIAIDGYDVDYAASYKLEAAEVLTTDMQ